MKRPKSLEQTDAEIRIQQAVLAAGPRSQADLDMLAEIDRRDPVSILDDLTAAVTEYLNANPETVDDMSIPMHHLSMAHATALIYRRTVGRGSN